MPAGEHDQSEDPLLPASRDQVPSTMLASSTTQELSHSEEHSRLGKDLTVLQKQAKSRTWVPAHDELILWEAERLLKFNALEKLMSVFQLPLDRFPDLAAVTWTGAASRIKQNRDRGLAGRGHAVERIKQARIREHEGVVEFCKNLPKDQPTPEASLLANYLLVPGVAAQKLMESLVDDMVVFQQHEHHRDAGTQLQPIFAERSFPQTLGAMYLIRVFTDEGSAQADVVFDSDRSLLSFARCASQPLIDAHRKAGKQATKQHLREVYMGLGPYHVTSVLYEVTLEGTDKEDALIPESAHTFAFVLPGPEMEHGGFLYLDEKDKLVGVNALSLLPKQTAFSFTGSEKVNASKETLDKLVAISYKLPSSMPDLIEAGVELCAWVGPKEVPGIETEAGALVYVSKDRSSVVSFQVLGAAPVMGRSSLRTEVNVAELPADEICPNSNAIVKSANSSVIETSLKLLRGNIFIHQNQWGGNFDYPSVAVTISRVCVPGALHPIILRGLAFAPQDGVLSTRGAQAIAFCAYHRAVWYVALQLFNQVIYLCCLMWFSKTLRKDTPGASTTAQTIDQIFVENGKSLSYAAFSAIFLIWLMNVAIFVRLFAVYRKWNWTREFFTKRRLVNALLLLCEPLLIVAMVPRNGIFYAEFLTTVDHTLVRLLIAILGSTCWFKSLVLLSGLETADLGNRILPISRTLGEMATFLMVMIFFFGAALSISYALTDEDLTVLWINTFRMAFAGDYSVGMFFRQKDPDEADIGHVEEQGFDWFVRFIFYCLCGILIVTALNNIFIGIMANTYDHYQERASRLFVRQRAHLALDETLLLARADRQDDKNKYVWFCTSRIGLEDDELLKECSDFSLRASLKDTQLALEEKMDKIEETVKQIAATQARA